MNKLKFSNAATPKTSQATPTSRPVPVLTADEEAFLDGISTSGNFTLEKVLGCHDIYADVEFLRELDARKRTHGEGGQP